MTKLTLVDLENLENQSSAVSRINANNALIEEAVERTLTRDGTSPNTMVADLDMNSNRILNLPEPVASTEPLRKTDVSDATITVLTGIKEDAEAAQAAAEAAQVAAETAETNAETAETNAETAETNAETAQTAAEVAQAAAEAAQSAAETAQTAAELAETNAETAETNAEAAQAAAETAQSGAETAETNAETAETNAETAQGLAEAARDAALAAQAAAETASDNFGDVYLGTKASDPVLDNDGNALVEGQLYWDSVGNQLKIYTGSAWVSYSAATGLTSVVDDLTPQLGGDLDLNTHVITGLVLGTDVQAYDAFLTSIASLGTAADKYIYTTGTDTAVEGSITSAGRAILDDADAAAQLATLGARGQGKETIWIPARAMWSRTTNGAAPVARELTTGGDLMIMGWGFDATTEEGVQFYLAMPKSWNKSTLTFTAYWTNTAGLTTETVSWGLSVGAFTNDDPFDTTDLGTEVRVSDTWLAQNDLHVTAESGAVTVGNTPIDDDLLIGQIVRSVANDNMTGDAELLGVKIHFTTNTATDV